MNKYISPVDSHEVEKAICYLVKKYGESGNNPKPVILHSIRMGIYLLESGYDTDVVIAAILHDLLEDTETTPAEIEDNFSRKIADWVVAVSFKPDIKEPVARYKEMFERTVQVGRAPVIIKAADLLANSIYIKEVSDLKKQKELIEKIDYFLSVTVPFSIEPVLSELASHYGQENIRLAKLEK